jgi:hypothetical protein
MRCSKVLTGNSASPGHKQCMIKIARGAGCCVWHAATVPNGRAGLQQRDSRAAHTEVPKSGGALPHSCICACTDTDSWVSAECSRKQSSSMAAPLQPLRQHLCSFIQAFQPQQAPSPCMTLQTQQQQASSSTQATTASHAQQMLLGNTNVCAKPAGPM